MEKKVIVVYGSKYGTTAAYAHWIAEELDCECIPSEQLAQVPLAAYDTVIYGGGLYASGIRGIKKLSKLHLNYLLLFTVGLADPKTTDYSKIISENSKHVIAANMKVFHLRGGIDYSRLSMVHKVMMAMLKFFFLDRKPEAELTADDKEMLRTYGGKVDFTDREQVRPIVEFARALQS